MMPTNQEERPAKPRSRNRKADQRNPKKAQSVADQVKREADPVIADPVSAMTATVEEAPVEVAPVEVAEAQAVPTELAPVEFELEQAVSEQAATDVAPVAAVIEKAADVA